MKLNAALFAITLVISNLITRTGSTADSTVDGSFSSVASSTSETIIFSSVTRVQEYFGRSNSSTYLLNTVIKGTNSAGEQVKLTLIKNTADDPQYDAFTQDCAKKASLALASPSTIGFRYTVNTGAAGVTRDSPESDSYSIKRDSRTAAIEARCTLAPASDSSSD